MLYMCTFLLNIISSGCFITWSGIRHIYDFFNKVPFCSTERLAPFTLLSLICEHVCFLDPCRLAILSLFKSFSNSFLGTEWNFQVGLNCSYFTEKFEQKFKKSWFKIMFLLVWTHLIIYTFKLLNFCVYMHTLPPSF